MAVDLTDAEHAHYWLTKLADTLEQSEPRFGVDIPAWDMDYWLAGRNECGTSACAIGHGHLARVLPPGLALRVVYADSIAEPAYENLTGFEAIAAAYRISHDAAFTLFRPRGLGYQPYNESPAVVRRIRLLAAVPHEATE